MSEANSVLSKRPLYETEAQRAKEREVLKEVAFQFDSEVKQTDIPELYDGIMVKGGIDWAYVEVRSRDVRYQERIEREGYMFSTIKWDRLQELARTDKPILLVVNFGEESYGLWIDADVQYPTRFAGRYIERETVRTEFERKKDKEVCYFIPWEEFTPLWNMT